jgi:hypothetical protein
MARTYGLGNYSIPVPDDALFTTGALQSVGIALDSAFPLRLD